MNDCNPSRVSLELNHNEQTVLSLLAAGPHNRGSLAQLVSFGRDHLNDLLVVLQRLGLIKIDYAFGFRDGDLVTRNEGEAADVLMTEEEWRAAESRKIMEESNAIMRATQPWLASPRSP
jgi:hypothetical protein